MKFSHFPNCVDFIFLIICLLFISKTFSFLQIFSLTHKNYLYELFLLEGNLVRGSKTPFRKCILKLMTDSVFHLPRGIQHLIKLLHLKQMGNLTFSYKSREDKTVCLAYTSHHN